MDFSASPEASIEGDERAVPAEGRRQGRREQRVAQAASTAGDVSLPSVLSAVVVERSQAGKCCGFLAADLPKFGHADQKRQRGTLADARNAQDQIEPLGEIVVGTKMLGNVSYLRGLACLQPCDVAVNNTPQARLVDMLEPCAFR